MKIAVIGHFRFPISQPFHGGLEMHTYLLVKALQARGHQVVTYAAAGSDPLLNVREAETYSRPKDHPIPPERMYGRTDPDASFQHHRYGRIMRELSEGDFDVIHNNSLHYLPLQLSKQLPAPMVTVLHTPPFPSMSHSAEIAAVHPHAHFVSISDHVRRIWAPHVGDSDVVLNGIKTSDFPYSDQPLNHKIAIWCGRFCPEKAPHLAIYAAIKAGYHIQLAGTVYDELYFNDLIRPYLDHPRVTYLGHQTHEQLSRRIGQASVGLFSSIWDEPFGLVMPEMLACGTPVVAFDSGAAREIINLGCGIIVPKGDVEAMAQAIPHAAQKNRSTCRQRAQDVFSHEHMIKGYESAYLRATAAYAAAHPTEGLRVASRAQVG